MPQRLGIIGHPIGHSISPVFQQAALDAIGFDGTYQPWDVAPDEVGEFVAGLRAPGTLGINVTVPHKEAVIPFLDEVDDWASTAGAVNTIVNRDGRLTGYNTDGIGFLRALREGADFEPRGRDVLVLGAGGSARGVVYALARVGVAQMFIANRTLERAEGLAALSVDSGAAAEALSLSDAPGAAREVALIVNCTSMGMVHGPDEDGTPLSAADIPSNALVNDLVYNPLETPLLREAAKSGAATLGGIQMLVYQGAASFEMWTEQDAPVAVMLEAATAAMRARG
ncbi:Shikimate dehydrogenase (NADP(+)) [Geodia barretti]|uniref:shikimate dehydrogenase (NADP(+)) n=1 Tax=Geodia barretti TaxID=519541 RepID=A0AA35RT34_GEOBA|nr:Shikimate dehydrogenase (NADP(+)) [Geodia barretti]